MNQRVIIRVTHVLFDDRYSGPAQRILRAAPLLRQLEVDTNLVLPDRGGNTHKKAPDYGVDCYGLSIAKIPNPRRPLQTLLWAIRFPLDVATFYRCFKRLNTDIVHISGALFIPPAIAALARGIPIVWHLNDTLPPSPLARILGIIVKTTSSIIVAQGHAVARHYGLSENDYSCIYSAVDTKIFCPASASSISDDDGRSRVGIIANWNPVKGLEFFIEAAALLDKKRKGRFEFVVAGPRLATHQRYAQSIDTLIAKHGLSDSFSLLGYIEDVPSLLNSWDVVVLASKNEGCPNVVLEAMSCEKPIVATDVGATRELVGTVPGNEAGVIVPPNDPSAIYKGVLHLLDNPLEQARLGANGRRRATSMFSLSQYAQDIETVYRSVAGQTS